MSQEIKLTEKQQNLVLKTFPLSQVFYICVSYFISTQDLELPPIHIPKEIAFISFYIIGALFFLIGTKFIIPLMKGKDEYQKQVMAHLFAGFIGGFGIMQTVFFGFDAFNFLFWITALIFHFILYKKDKTVY